MKYRTELIGLAIVIAIAGAVHYFLNIRGKKTDDQAPAPEPATPDNKPVTGGPSPVQQERINENLAARGAIGKAGREQYQALKDEPTTTINGGSGEKTAIKSPPGFKTPSAAPVEKKSASQVLRHFIRDEPYDPAYDYDDDGDVDSYDASLAAGTAKS